MKTNTPLPEFITTAFHPIMQGPIDAVLALRAVLVRAEEVSNQLKIARTKLSSTDSNSPRTPEEDGEILRRGYHVALRCVELKVCLQDCYAARRRLAIALITSGIEYINTYKTNEWERLSGGHEMSWNLRALILHNLMSASEFEGKRADTTIAEMQASLGGGPVHGASCTNAVMQFIGDMKSPYCLLPAWFVEDQLKAAGCDQAEIDTVLLQLANSRLEGQESNLFTRSHSLVALTALIDAVLAGVAEDDPIRPKLSAALAAVKDPTEVLIAFVKYCLLGWHIRFVGEDTGSAELFKRVAQMYGDKVAVPQVWTATADAARQVARTRTGNRSYLGTIAAACADAVVEPQKAGDIARLIGEHTYAESLDCRGNDPGMATYSASADRQGCFMNQAQVLLKLLQQAS